MIQEKLFKVDSTTILFECHGGHNLGPREKKMLSQDTVV